MQAEQSIEMIRQHQLSSKGEDFMRKGMKGATPDTPRSPQALSEKSAADKMAKQIKVRDIASRVQSREISPDLMHSPSNMMNHLNTEIAPIQS